MPENKFVKNNLEDLIKKFSQFDVIEHIENNYKIENLKYVSYNNLCDNHFIKTIKYNSEHIDEIAKSIQENGLYTPLIVKKTSTDGKYEVIIGRKRWVACKKIKYENIPIIITNNNDEEILLMLLADSRDNKYNNPVETALIINELNKKYKYRKNDIARILNCSSSQVSNYLSILTLPEDIIVDVSTNKLSLGHAKAISRLSSDEIRSIVDEIYKDNLSVRDTERLVQRLNYKKKKKKVNHSLMITIEDGKIIIRSKSKTKLSKAFKIVKKSLKNM